VIAPLLKRTPNVAQQYRIGLERGEPVYL